MTLKVYLGAFLGVLAISGLILNLFVLFAVVKLGICSWLFEGGKDNGTVRLLGTLFLFCWYFNSVTQMIMAVDRLIAVCFPFINFFTYTTSSILVSGVVPIAIILSWISQHVLPCCMIAPDHQVLSYSYIIKDGVLNYANLFVDTPIDIISSVTSITCYTYILAFMRRMRGDCRNRTNRHGLREYRYALQFFAICIFYLAAWLCRRTLPLIVGAGRVEYFIAVPICVALNCSANSLVYITTNPEVRRNLSIRRTTLIGLTTQSVGNIRTAPANPKTQA